MSENSSLLSPNTTESPDDREWALIQIIIPPYIFTLSALGLLGNGFVLLVLSLQKDPLTVPEIYLGNLALADLTLLTCLPFWAMNIHNHYNWPYGEALCKIVNAAIIVNFYTSVYIIAVISVDRFLALLKTMTARWLRRTLYAKVICVVLWLFGFLMSTPNLVYRTVRFDEGVGTTSCILDYGATWILAHGILMNVVGFVLPVLITVFCSCAVIRALNGRRKGVCSSEGNDRKATALLYAVTILFLVCWGPFHLFTILDVLCELELLNETLWGHTLNIGHQVSVYVAFLNSALNPALYVFSGRYFRSKVSAIYRNTRHGRRGSDMSAYQRSVISTYINRTEQIKPVITSL